MTERLFVLDAPGFLYRAYHAMPYLSTSKGVPCHAVFGMSTMLWKLLREESPEYFAAAWDPPGPTFREERFAAYKETRPAMPDDLRAQIPYVKALFEALRVPLLEVAGFEADDVLGTLVDRVRDQPVRIDHPDRRFIEQPDKRQERLIRVGCPIIKRSEAQTARLKLPGDVGEIVGTYLVGPDTPPFAFLFDPADILLVEFPVPRNGKVEAFHPAFRFPFLCLPNSASSPPG
jgi:hypothetical protein